MRKISGLVTAGPKKHGRTSWAHFLQSPELWYRLTQAKTTLSLHDPRNGRESLTENHRS